LVELASQAKYVPGAVDKKAAAVMRKTLDLLLDRKSMDINYSVGKTCLEGSSNELFFAYIEQTGSGDNVIFEVDPFQTEQVQNWLALALDQDLDVDAVQWESGEAADYFKGPDALILWVACDHPLARGEERTLRVRYHGVVVQREDDWVRFDPGAYWYPRVVPG